MYAAAAPRVKEVADSLYESRRAELAAAPGIPQMSRLVESTYTR